jgi:hypothetical protein
MTTTTKRAVGSCISSASASIQNLCADVELRGKTVRPIMFPEKSIQDRLAHVFDIRWAARA